MPSGKKQVEDTGVPDVEEEPVESEEERGETVFTFDSFEQVYSTRLWFLSDHSHYFLALCPSRCYADTDVVFSAIQRVQVPGEHEACSVFVTSASHSSEGRRIIFQGLWRLFHEDDDSPWVLKVSTLNLFKLILSEEKSLPREQAYKDLVALINYILRKFFKEVAEDPFLLVEACPGV